MGLLFACVLSLWLFLPSFPQGGCCMLLKITIVKCWVRCPRLPPIQQYPPRMSAVWLCPEERTQSLSDTYLPSMSDFRHDTFVFRSLSYWCVIHIVQNWLLLEYSGICGWGLFTASDSESEIDIFLQCLMMCVYVCVHTYQYIKLTDHPHVGHKAAIKKQWFKEICSERIDLLFTFAFDHCEQTFTASHSNIISHNATT